MEIEIERKFLLRSEEWRFGATAHKIAQGYLSREPYRTVRVRLKDEHASMAVKVPTAGISRAEIEFSIAPQVARVLFALCLEGLIEKTRYELWDESLLWEIDEFHGENAGLIVAEVELPSEDYPFARPSWLGPEVSSDPRFSNSMLARRPWSLWSEEERAAVLASARSSE